MVRQDGGHAAHAGIPEPNRNRREAERFAITLKLSVSIENTPGGLLVLPAAVRDISRLGVLLETRRMLPVSQAVTVAIPTESCPDGMSLPRAFVGAGVVVRAQEIGKGKHHVGIRFAEVWVQHVEFGAFMDFLHSKAQSTSQIAVK